METEGTDDIAPARDEAAPYYFGYIDKVPKGNVLRTLAVQAGEIQTLFGSFTEERSLHRYAPGKWSVREVLNHVSDVERLLVSRAFWFARGFDTQLPSFDEKDAAGAARADEFSWASHVDEFRAVRASTVAFFRNLPAEAWTRRGVASGFPFSVRALAWITAGHLAHHAAILRERYVERRLLVGGGTPAGRPGRSAL